MAITPNIKSGLDRVLLRSAWKLNLLAAGVGLMAGYGAIGLRCLISFFRNIFLYQRVSFDATSPLDYSCGPWVVAVPALGLLITAYLVKWLAKEAQGHGVPEVITAVLTAGGRMRKRVVAVKAFASAITIGAGGSVGREGPIVQIGAAAGSVLGQWLDLPPKQLKILVGCGAGGAIAASFNTPIAGVIFAVELIVLEWKATSFMPLVVASVFATVVSRWTLGNEPAFIVPDYSFVNPVELIFYLGLAVLSGLIGALTVRTLYWMEGIFERAPIPFFAKPIVAGFIIGGAGYFYPGVFGQGYEAVSAVLLQDMSLKLMGILLLLKIVMMSVTLSGKGSGGIFAPTLFIGAMLGGAYGILVNHFFPDISAGYGAYALVGMAAVLSATSSAVFTSIVILFEMTLDYPIILPLMFVCVIAGQVSLAINRGQSIFSLELIRKGISFVQDFGVNVLAVTSIKEIMNRDLDLLYDDMTLGQAHKATSVGSHTLYPVVDHKGKFKGMVRASNVNYQFLIRGPGARITDFLMDSPNVVKPNETVLETLRDMNEKRDPRFVVVEQETGHLLGIVSPTDFVRLISREMKE